MALEADALEGLEEQRRRRVRRGRRAEARGADGERVGAERDLVDARDEGLGAGGALPLALGRLAGLRAVAAAEVDRRRPASARLVAALPADVEDVDGAREGLGARGVHGARGAAVVVLELRPRVVAQAPLGAPRLRLEVELAHVASVAPLVGPPALVEVGAGPVELAQGLG